MSKDSALALATGTSTPSSTPQEAGVEAVVKSENPQQQQQLQSTAFSIHAKKEAELVRQRNEFKKEREVWEQERSRLADAKRQYDAYNEAKKTDPVAALKMLGFSETDIFNYMANAQPPELSPEQKAAQAAEAAAEAKIKAFEEGQLKKEKDAQIAQDRSVLQDYRKGIVQTIRKDLEKFEYCNYYGREALELAYETAKAIAKESNGEDIISAQEAAQLAEEFYEEKDKEMNQLKKRGFVTQPVPQTKQEPVRSRTLSEPGKDTPKPAINKTRTLSNGVTSTIASTRLKMNETRDQKRERLINALRNGSL